MKLSFHRQKKSLIRSLLFLLLFISLLGVASFFTSSILSSEQSSPVPAPPDTIRTQKKPQGDTLYQHIIRNADNYFSQKQYDQAVTEYEKALKMKPYDQSVKEKINKGKAAIVAQKKAMEDYQRYVGSADNYLKLKDYLNAKAAYQMAIDSKPDDTYAKGKLKETMDLLRSQKATNILYDVAIASAEKLFQAKDYEKAKGEFEKASRVNPSDQYAKDRINECIKVMIDLKTKEEMYAKAIETADKFYASKNWQDALLQYQDASVIKPDEKYPQDRIAELTLLLKSMKEKDDAYNKAIASADKLFKDESYPDSRTDYQNASRIKPEQDYPKNRIREIDDILGNKKKIDSQYMRVIAVADSFYIEKNFLLAKNNYQQALTLKPREAYPKEMITKSDNLMAGYEANAKALEETYQSTIANADKLFADKSWEQARSEYQNALKIKPVERYPKDKIAAIDAILTGIEKQKAFEEKYTQLITAADKLLSEKSYDKARPAYIEASGLKPAEEYPKTKISEIDKVFAENAKLKAREDQYNKLINDGDKLFGEKSYETAKSQYSQASQIKTEEQYPKDKIAEIEKILAGIAGQKAMEEKYKGIIANADKLFAAKTYDQARAEYSNGSALKPSEQYPKDKITEIDKILSTIADQKVKDIQYKSAIDGADKLFAGKSYDQSKSGYQSALAIKPAEEYPKQKITEIDKILEEIARQKALDDQYADLITKADKLLSEKSYEHAKIQYQAALNLKSAEKYPKDRIAEIDIALADMAKQKALDDQYQSILKDADKLLADMIYDQAKTKYSAASALKSLEQYPKDKIAEIDKILAGIADQKATDERYKGIIANADKLFAAKTYDQARAEYSNGSALKPSEQYPKDKIEEIDKILSTIADQKVKDIQYKSAIDRADKLFADKSYDRSKSGYQSALAIKPAEDYPTQKIAEIDKIFAEIARLKALDDQYADFITKADKLLAEKSYEPAKNQYQAALNIKSAEKYPKDKIAEIDVTLADMAKQKALDDQYQSVLKDADKLLADKIYDQAKTKYSAASALKSLEQYPKDKIAEIDKILAEIAKQKTIDDQYKVALGKADRLFTDKSYEQAKQEYLNAGNSKPAEQYPKDKVAEIDNLLAEYKAKEEAYKAAITKADQFLQGKSYDNAKNEYQNALTIKPDEQYPKNKIEDINKTLSDLMGKRKLFDDLVKKGDDFSGQKDFYKAKEQYQQALTIFSEEPYPRQRLNRMNSAIDSIYRQNKGFYDKAVAEGDKAYNGFIFDKAIDSYTEAARFLPMETYPKEMISKIKKIITENAIVDVFKSTVVVSAGTEKQFPFTPVNFASRKNNYVYVKIKNMSDKPFNVLLRYGKDKQTNGGVSIRNLASDGKIYDRLISVREQDPWYREDNNWISIYPQGGDVEISFIQVSRSQ
ncbi:MAG: hypothetical protein NTX61_10195 [Bacteroidetes bacterium]|nr:hypothetical protein [Bacteroidota bacterium]